MLNKIIYNIDYDDDKENLLLLYPRHNVKSDIHKIIRAHALELHNDYNIITLYDDGDDFSDGFYTINEALLYDDNTLYDIVTDITDFQIDIHKVVIVGLLYDISATISVIFDHLLYSIQNATKLYLPILLNFTQEENTLGLDILKLDTNMKFHSFDDSFSAFYDYTYNMFGRYNIPTLNKPYICLYDDNIETDEYIDEYIKKINFFSNYS